MLPVLPLALVAISACQESWTAQLRAGSSGRTVVEVADSGKIWRHVVAWPIWNFARGDADGDGCSELLLGVVKRNRFDSLPRRRLQVWRIDRGRMRPGWLGTRLSGELDTFSLNGPGRILVREHVGDRWHLSRWSWSGFGYRRDTILSATRTRPPFPSTRPGAPP